MTFATAALVFSSALSAGSKIRAGHAADYMYQAQAAQTLIQARSNVLKARAEENRWKDRGVMVLEKMNKTLATINARSKGSIDPFAGSTGKLGVNVLDTGYLDYGINLDNAALAQQNQAIIHHSAQYQAGIYRVAGRQARQAGYIGAATTIGSAAFQYSQMGGPATGGSTLPPQPSFNPNYWGLNT